MSQEMLITSLARKFGAYKNCEENGNTEWLNRHAETIVELVDKYLPHGSGFDRGTNLEFAASKPNRLVFYTEFHHMNDFGGYCGWSYHNVVVTPDLQSGFNLRVTGQDRRHIKEYIAETFYECLSQLVDEYERQAAYNLERMNEKAS